MRSINELQGRQPLLKSLLANLLPLGGIALLWRIAQYLSPSIGMTMVGIFLFITLAVVYVKEVPVRQIFKWAWLILLGGSLNFAAILGHGGVMPMPAVMSSAWWVWLGDWIGGIVSPGDILMVIGFCGIVTTVLIKQRELVERYRSVLGYGA